MRSAEASAEAKEAFLTHFIREKNTEEYAISHLRHVTLPSSGALLCVACPAVACPFVACPAVACPVVACPAVACPVVACPAVACLS